MTAFPLGFFGDSNPDGNSETAFNAGYSSFTSAMGGAQPTHVDTFIDDTINPSEYAANASWMAWSLASTGSHEVGSPTAIPVIGVPMATTSTGDPDSFYKAIIGGTYDADYKAIVDAFAANGYKTIEMRLGYEFDGNWMPWSPYNSSSPTADADFVAAWRHLANLVHEEGQVDGITVATVWDPDVTNWTPNDVRSLYPGNQYVDVIGVDVYNPQYPIDLTNWASGSTSTQEASQAAWASSAVNREYYWTFENATEWQPNPDLSYGSGWSMYDAVQFAINHGKPLSVSETGASGNDAAFPKWLAYVLAAGEQFGLKVDSVNVWDASPSDGNWHFSGGAQPAEAAAWDEYFGAGSTVPAVTICASLMATLASLSFLKRA